MTRIKLTLWLLLAATTGLWLYADPIFSGALEFGPVRNALINYSGIIGIAAMSFSMLLAVRPVLLETYFDGLDKMYRLHKWLGITGLVFSVLHWVLANGPKWLTDLGLMERGARGPRGARVEPDNPILAFFQEQRHLATGLGEWAFYIGAALMVLALIKWLPYRWFHKTHVWLAAAYLPLAFHSLVLMKFGYWETPLAPLVTLLLAAGSLAALISLFERIGKRRRAAGIVESVMHHADNRVLQVTVKLPKGWRGHNAGQFAFLTFDRKEGAHPFTIASAWQGDGRLTFLIKELGDYTRRLPHVLKAGDAVTVEGPYGRFDFDARQTQQVWIAGGIGISPFVARMEALSAKPDGKQIDLFYATAAPNQDFIPALRQRCEQAGVRLHVLISPRDGVLQAADIVRQVPQWKSADVWFCGPSQFGRKLRHELTAWGLAPQAFHQEFFEMR